MRCSRCQLINWADAITCKSCGANLRTSTSSSAATREDLPYDRDARVGYRDRSIAQPIVLKTGVAIASMVVGIVSIVSCGVAILLGPIGLAMGIVALRKTSKEPHVYGGRGFAIAGITTSACSLLIVVPIIAAIAIPNLLASRRAANEASAISGLRTLYSAEATFLSVNNTQACADLGRLASANLIDPTIASGIKSGYRYEVAPSASGRGCELFATPLSQSTGNRSFVISSDGIMRGAKKNSQKAEISDPEIVSER